MKIIFSTLLLLLGTLAVGAQVSVKWQLSDKDNLSATSISGDTESLLTTAFAQGTAIDSLATMTSGNAASGYTAPVYEPPFTQFYVSTKKTGKAGGHNLAVSVTPKSGNSFKPTKITFDAAKCGTDGGNFDVYIKTSSTTERALATTQVPLRNRAQDGNPNGYSHHEYTLSDQIVDGEAFLVFIYIYNINGTDVATPKAIAFRNLVIEGAIDEPIYDASHYITDATFLTASGQEESIFSLISGLQNGGLARYGQLLYGDPTQFTLTMATGFSYAVEYVNNTAHFTINNANGAKVFEFSVVFRVTHRQPKPAATPLKRGLMAVNLSASGSSGNLVSWRYRLADDNQVKFKLYRGTNASSQTTALNKGEYIYARTNFRDTGGNASSYYRLEVYDLNDNLLETEVSRKTWANQSMEVVTKTPTDTRGLGSTYTPNDAAFYDMDGDGEYEIVLKWDPSNSKDAASNGVTSDTYIDCYKLDGTQLWRINIGPNIRSGAHTTPFVVWDFDGDGYGELICKTAPGTVDGEGNYVVMSGDDPTASWLNGRGKPDAGPEYVTVFDGLTGAELSTMSYHTKYGDVSASGFWGDSNQNRSERYLACVAHLDGVTPSAILCRGYYRGAAVGAYDWDGMQLTLRWLHRSATSGQGLWGEGAHFVLSGDVDEDGCDEIVYGAACLDNDGKGIVYRTGLGHGDALHMSDFDWDNPGQEVFMPHEEKPYGYELRDARTGKLLVYQTAGGDTGRGLAANFDSSHDGAELMASCTGALMDCKGQTIADSWAIGSSGAAINNRIYWDGDPYDEFFDKSIIAHWNANGRYFDRIQVNGSNYTPGTLCNYTKNNPCVMGDLLGDWREELVTYNSASNALIITVTNFESDYRMPHLMDHRQYAQLIANQNCGYNQPPHLPFDPARTYALSTTIPASGWVAMYAPYALQLPEGVDAFYVGSFNTELDTVKLTRIATTIPARTGFLLRGTPGTSVTLKTASVSPTTPSANKLMGDHYLPVEIETIEQVSYYKWGERDDLGIGFFRVSQATIPAGEPYLKVTAASARDAEYYLIGQTAVGIEEIGADKEDMSQTPTFSLSGRPMDKGEKGVHIRKGRKILSRQ